MNENIEFEITKCCYCGDELTFDEDLKNGLCWVCKAFKDDRRIEEDIHTNTHYDLINGRMWMKGHATGKFWSLLCNSREAQRDVRLILGLN